MVTTFRHCLRIVLLSTLAVSLPGCVQQKIRLLMIDGQSNHNWENMRPIMRDALVNTGRFSVDVVTTPPTGAPAEQWLAFRPQFSRYDAVLSNYNDTYPRGRGDRWPREVEEALEKYVDGGGGLMVIHAANNAFLHWEEWNKMIGLGWRDKSFGDWLTLDDQGKVIRTPRGEGLDSSHGDVHEFRIIVRDPRHPVMKGIPMEWMHAGDELYHAQRGPAVNIHILASAYSSQEKHGTGRHEPMVWTGQYGKGRVLGLLLGHTTDRSTAAIRCVGFQTIMCRGAEWAATGRVTVPIPKNFPTASHVSLASDETQACRTMQ